MRSLRLLVVAFPVVLAMSACGHNADKPTGNGSPQCSDGIDNDGDGLIDFPDDPGCVSPEDNSEDSPTSPQCMDGRDNDGDGLIDYPNDPGCFAPQQDDETDDCPDGPGCPQCGNKKDDDNNGLIDFPADPGCSAASDTLEFTDNPQACGAAVMIQQLPGTLEAMGTLSGASNLSSPTCGGAGPEAVYLIHVESPKVVVATTENPATTANTVLYIRSGNCVDPASELACNDDDMPQTSTASTVTASITQPGAYFIVVDSFDSSGGAYDLHVQYFVGEGQPCSANDDCGPSLVCRVPDNGTMKVCSKHVCQDGVDNDNDGKIDYPNDPGCDSPTDDDETDDCPSGPNCPECGNGIDDDNDGKIDYPADPQCIAASSASEACVSHEPVATLTMPMTTGDTTMATDDVHPTCSNTGSTAPDLTYRLDLPQLANLDINLNGNADMVGVLYDQTCGGTELSCLDEFEGDTVMTNVASGTYYYVVDGWDTTELGPFTITISGTIPNGAGCEYPLVASGALSCNAGYTCKGVVGSRTCAPAACSDGIDNDSDGKTDYPFDPGCSSPDDDTEADPTPEPVCADMMDNDTDGTTDFPADYGCVAASGTSEVFCVGEMDPTSLVTTMTTTGTTTGKSADHTATCGSGTATPDVAYALQLPVHVASLQVDTIGSTFDTLVTWQDANCASELACDDDSGGNTTSMLTLTNVTPGGYAITISGYEVGEAGAYTLNVHGVVAAGTDCTSPLFTGGAAAVLSCPSATTCTGGKCQ